MHWNKISIGFSEYNKIGPNWVIKTSNTFEVQRKSEKEITIHGKPGGSWNMIRGQFCRLFKKDYNVAPSQAIPLPRDITSLDNEELTRTATGEQIN